MSRSANALLAANRPCSTTASSSAVRSGTVAIRQCSITWSPSNTPSTVLVFPMSTVSSMSGGLPFCLTGSGQHHRHVVDEPGAAHGGGDREHRGAGLAGRHGGERGRIDERQVIQDHGGLRGEDLPGGGQHRGGAGGGPALAGPERPRQGQRLRPGAG